MWLFQWRQGMVLTCQPRPLNLDGNAGERGLRIMAGATADVGRYRLLTSKFCRMAQYTVQTVKYHCAHQELSLPRLESSRLEFLFLSGSRDAGTSFFPAPPQSCPTEFHQAIKL